MNENIFKVLMAFVSLLGTILTYVIVPFLIAKKEEIKSKLSDKQLNEIEFWTEIAVIAVEKKFENKVGAGILKKEEVINFLSNNLALDKYMNKEQLNILVDAVVENVINKE